MKIIIKLMAFIFCLITSELIADESAGKDVRLTRAEIIHTVENTIAALNSSYLFPEKATSVSKALTLKLTAGEFYQDNELLKFTKKLGIILRELADDNYFEVIENNSSVDIGHTANYLESNRAKFGSITAEVLAGNIGYLEIKHLSSSGDATLNIHNAFEYLNNVHAMIIDLRSVEGESLPFTQNFLSYFFEPDTAFMDVYYERESKKQSLKAMAISSELRIKAHLPIYILNSAFVSGAGELISYTLQHFDKAVILGEKTMGNAYISQIIQVGEYVKIKMPYGIYKHPISDGNWEGNGVEPDFDLSAAKSLDAAYQLAKTQVLTF